MTGLESRQRCIATVPILTETREAPAHPLWLFNSAKSKEDAARKHIMIYESGAHCPNKILRMATSLFALNFEKE